MWMLSFVSLLGIIALCTLGTFHPKYADNLLERVGMGVGAFVSGALAEKVFLARSVDPACGLFPIAVFIFAIGIALKSCSRQRELEIGNERHIA